MKYKYLGELIWCIYPLIILIYDYVIFNIFVRKRRKKIISLDVHTHPKTIDSVLVACHLIKPINKTPFTRGPVFFSMADWPFPKINRYISLYEPLRN